MGLTHSVKCIIFTLFIVQKLIHDTHTSSGNLNLRPKPKVPLWFLAEVKTGQKFHHCAKMSSLLQVETQIGSHKIEMLAGRKPLGDSTSAQHEPKTPPPIPFLMPPPFTKPLKYIPGLPIKRPRCNDAVPPGTVKNNISQS